jgi:hypothetical protein
MAVLVSEGHAPGGGRIAGGCGGHGAGQVRIQGAEPGGFARIVGQAEQGGQGNGQVDPRRGPGRLTGPAWAVPSGRAVFSGRTLIAATFPGPVVASGSGGFPGSVACLLALTLPARPGLTLPARPGLTLPARPGLRLLAGSGRGLGGCLLVLGGAGVFAEEGIKVGADP